MRLAFGLALWICAGVEILGAQVLPLGPDFQVNNYTTGRQHDLRLSADPAGEFLATWTSQGSPGDDDIHNSVQAQRFSAWGSPIGPQFQVNSLTSESESGAESGFLPGGDFVVVWSRGSKSPNSSRNVYGRCFAGDGTPLVPDFHVNEPPGYEYLGAAGVAVGKSGEFLVVWDSGYGVRGRRFSSACIALDGEFEIASGGLPDLALQSSGGFVVVWRVGTAIRGRQLDEQGLPIGDEIPINTTSEGFLDRPDVAATANGGFVVAWASPLAGYDEFLRSIRARRFDEHGSPLSAEFQVNTYSGIGQSGAAVAGEPSGGFIVAWTSEFSHGGDDSASIQARRFAEDGLPLGAQFQVNSFTPSYQYSASIQSGTEGRALIGWQSHVSPGTDSSYLSVVGRLFRVPDFFDGFESGDTSRWSATQGRAASRVGLGSRDRSRNQNRRRRPIE